MGPLHQRRRALILPLQQRKRALDHDGDIIGGDVTHHRDHRRAARNVLGMKGTHAASIDLRHAGTASEYRGIDFRKPLTGRLNGHAHSLDIPVYNGRYSTNCYVDEVRRALDRPGSEFASIALKCSIVPTLFVQGKSAIARRFSEEALEAAGAPYVDVARGPEDAGRGVPALLRTLADRSLRQPPFAPEGVADREKNGP